jgi:hypothetical protein
MGFLVVHSDGAVRNVVAAPRPQDVQSIIAFGTPALDPSGRLYYRGALAARPTNGIGFDPQTAKPQDSLPVIRGDFSARRLDTIGMVGVTSPKREVVVSTSGTRTTSATVNPVAVHDDWAVLADGSLALVRARDYHIDWVRADGSRMSSPKMPFDWRRITDEEKRALVDSTSKAMQAILDHLPASTLSSPRPTFKVVGENEISDYFPAIRPGTLKADLSGNLWVPPSSSRAAKPGTLMYDVINSLGQIIRRVQFPAGYVLVGFGRRETLYMARRDSAGVHLVRARVGAAVDR